MGQDLSVLCLYGYSEMKIMGRPRTEPRIRFDAQWVPEPFTNCWLWSGKEYRGGYGHFKLNDKTIKAHRASWMLHRGDIPDGMLVCHKCDTPGCVNPDHLFTGTHIDNVRDCIRKGRRADISGENNPMHSSKRRAR